MQQEDPERRFIGPQAAAPYRFGIVASRFNESIVSRLLDSAVDCLARHGAAKGAVRIVRVPGSWEIPVAVRTLLRQGGVDGVIALGALIRGETSHFELIAGEVARGLAMAAEESGIPVTFGILATETLDQAADRAGGRLGNRGWDAAVAAIESAAALGAIRDAGGRRP